MDPYIFIFAVLAVVTCLCLYSVLGLRTGSERPFRVSALTRRLSTIAFVLCVVNYVAYEAKWYAAIEAALLPTAVPTASVPGVDSVPIYPTNDGTSARIDVQLGGQPLRMLLDTGATTCLISEAIAARIVRDGYGVWQGTDRFKLADGTIRTLPTLLIREVRIGRHTVRTVRAGVTSTGELLLAFPVVDAIAPFTIDTRARVLIFHTSSNSTGGGQIAASTPAAPIISGPARVIDGNTVVVAGMTVRLLLLLTAMAFCAAATLVLSFLHWKDWKAQKPGQGDGLTKTKSLDGLPRGRPRLMKRFALLAVVALAFAVLAYVAPDYLSPPASTSYSPRSAATGSVCRCEGCGCKGGPGWRGQNGQCVSHSNLTRDCGSPPSARCTYEGTRQVCTRS